jgi:hypothetical protein
MNDRDELREVYQNALAFIRTGRPHYRLLTEGERSARFKISGVADAEASIELREDSVMVQTESLYGLAPKHSAAVTIKAGLASRRDLFTEVRDEKGLVFSLKIEARGRQLLANGTETDLKAGELIEDLKTALDLAHAYHHHFTAGI